MTLFFPDIVLFDDPAGMSYWLSGHFYEHKAFLQAGLILNFNVADYDLYAFDVEDKESQRGWIEAHGLVHDSLRQLSGVTGPDFTEVDFAVNRQFDDWMWYHAQEHQALRQFFGLT